FPRTVWTEKTEDLTLLHVEGNIVDRSEVSIFLYDVLHFDRVGCFGHGCRSVNAFRFCAQVGRHCCPAAAALCELLSPFICCGETSTSAVIPGTNAPFGLSRRTFRTIVLISRFIRLTSRWVAKSPSTPLKKTLPLVIIPPGIRTRITSP